MVCFIAASGGLFEKESLEVVVDMEGEGEGEEFLLERRELTSSFFFIANGSGKESPVSSPALRVFPFPSLKSEIEDWAFSDDVCTLG